MDGLSPSRRRQQSGLYLDLESFDDLKGTGKAPPCQGLLKSMRNTILLGLQNNNA
jgi:hypothetical protein